MFFSQSFIHRPQVWFFICTLMNGLQILKFLLNLRIKTESVTAEVDATVYVRFLLTEFGSETRHISLHLSQL